MSFRWALSAVLSLGLLAAAPPARCEGDDVLRRLEQLERLLAEQAAEIARLKAAAAGRSSAPAAPAPAVPATAPAPAAGASAWGGPPPPPPPAPASLVDGRDLLRAGPAARHGPVGGLRWGGYATIEWINPSNANSFFDLHRLILACEAPITRCIDFQAEIEFEHGGNGGAGHPIDGEVVVEQAELLFRLSDAVRPKAGALLVPFGRSNLYHDDPIHDFTLRPWTARFLVPTGFAVPGAGVEGAFPVGCHTLTYDIVLNNGVKDAFGANDGIRPARQSWRKDNNEDKQWWGRAAMAWSVPGFSRLETGVSGTYGQYDDAGQNDLTGFALDLLARIGPFEVTAEYVDYTLERDAADPAGAIRGLNGTWIEAAYHFMPCAWRRACSCLVEPTSHFTLAARYMTTDLNDEVRGAAFRDDLKAWGVALNYRITERTVIRVDHTWYEPVVGADVRELAVSLSTYF